MARTRCDRTPAWAQLQAAYAATGKALDVRLRLPPGFEALETPVRAALAAAFKRGNLQVSLSLSGQLARETVRLNQDILDRLVAAGCADDEVEPVVTAPVMSTDPLLKQLETMKA